MRYIHEKNLNDFGWYLLANDETHVIMENLKTFLVYKCPMCPTSLIKMHFFAK